MHREHMLFGTLIFVVLGSIAVCMDLIAGAVQEVGVSPFTYRAIELTAHGMLVLDLVLFTVYLAKSSWILVKETLK